MSVQPEALRLADALDYGVYDAQMARVMDQSAAELRRLSAENEAFGIHLSERMKDLARVEAQRDALLEALKSTGLFLHHCWCDVQMNDYSFEKLNQQMAVVDAAIKAVEEGK